MELVEHDKFIYDFPKIRDQETNCIGIEVNLDFAIMI